MLLNEGNGILGDSQRFAMANRGWSTAIIAADLNGDNRPDLISTNDGCCTVGPISVLINSTFVNTNIPGDSNGDGIFDSGDLITVFQAGEYEDAITGNSTFEEGDWDGDGDFTSSDLVYVFREGSYSQAALTTIAIEEIFQLSREDLDSLAKR